MTVAVERPKGRTRSAEIRDKLGYLIIDTDVHTQEFESPAGTSHQSEPRLL